jgi:hypothetical protein
METVLLLITLISVAIAIVAFMSARRAQRRERERSEARVAALSAAADTPGAGTGGWTQTAGEWHWNAQPLDVTRAAEAARNVTRDLGFAVRPNEPLIADHQPPAASETSDRFFGTVQRDEPSSGRLPVIAAAALILLIGGAFVFLNAPGSGERSETAARAAQTEPLELVALGHSGDVRQLTISGTVRNPSTGAKLEGLTAVVSLLDRNGGFLSTKDVPLDYRALGPGEEAPFKVSIPAPGSIARYRVSFRAGTDVVPHVDRRNDAKLASAVQ